MNLEKLNDELAKASQAKAECELDRMIKIHQEEVAKYTNAIKLYIQQIATVPGKATDYNISNENMSFLIRHKAALEIMLKLKEELN